MKYLGLPLSVWKLRKVDYQYLEDKAAAKLTTWDGQNITSSGQCTLVKLVLTSQVIYHIITLNPPPSTLNNLNKIERIFCDQTMRRPP